jgi:predicted DNA-binding protein with PD1-like motif
LVTARSGNLILIRLVDGDDLLESLKSALEKEGVTSGVLLGGVGMLSDAVLGYYAGDGRYETFEVGEEVELCAVNGNVSTFEGDQVMHLTNELAVMVSGAGMKRKVDEDTGLKLLWFEN